MKTQEQANVWIRRRVLECFTSGHEIDMSMALRRWVGMERIMIVNTSFADVGAH